MDGLTNSITGLQRGFLDSAANARMDSKLLNAKSAAASGGKSSFEDMLKQSIDKAENVAALSGIKSAGAGKRPVDRKLMDACYDMESIFVSKMLKEMRKTVPKNEWLHGGFAEEIFEDMLYDEYSKSVSRTANLGLAKMLYNELSRNR